MTYCVVVVTGVLSATSGMASEVDVGTMLVDMRSPQSERLGQVQVVWSKRFEAVSDNEWGFWIEVTNESEWELLLSEASLRNWLCEMPAGSGAVGPSRPLGMQRRARDVDLPRFIHLGRSGESYYRRGVPTWVIGRLQPAAGRVRLDMSFDKVELPILSVPWNEWPVVMSFRVCGFVLRTAEPVFFEISLPVAGAARKPSEPKP